MVREPSNDRHCWVRGRIIEARGEDGLKPDLAFARYVLRAAAGEIHNAVALEVGLRNSQPRRTRNMRQQGKADKHVTLRAAMLAKGADRQWYEFALVSGAEVGQLKRPGGCIAIKIELGVPLLQAKPSDSRLFGKGISEGKRAVIRTSLNRHAAARLVRLGERSPSGCYRRRGHGLPLPQSDRSHRHQTLE